MATFIKHAGDIVVGADGSDLDIFNLLSDAGSVVTPDPSPTSLLVAAPALPSALEISGLGGATILGTGNADTLAGGAGADFMAGKGGDDSISGGGGRDLIFGGAGNDVFTDFAAGDFIIGGRGVDTLRLTGGDQTLDLTLVGNHAIQGVEVIDLSGPGDDTLKFTFEDVKGMVGKGGTLQIDQDAGDTLVTSTLWIEDSAADGYTFYHATQGHQTVYLKVEGSLEGGPGADAPMSLAATAETDDLVGGSGNDTISFGGGTYQASDSVNGGGGTDTLIVDGLDFDMTQATFHGLENVVLQGNLDFVADDEALQIVSESGNHDVVLGNNSAQTYLGTTGQDIVTFGAAGQSVNGGDFEGGGEGGGPQPDQFVLDAAFVAGSTLIAEGHTRLDLVGTGTADLTQMAGFSGIAILNYAAGVNTIVLTDEGIEQINIANHATTFVSGAGDDTFWFFPNVGGGLQITIDNFEVGASGDQLIFSSGLSNPGAYLGAVSAANVNATFAANGGVHQFVFDTTNHQLIFDYDGSDSYDANLDVTIHLAGVSDVAGSVGVF